MDILYFSLYFQVDFFFVFFFFEFGHSLYIFCVCGVCVHMPIWFLMSDTTFFFTCKNACLRIFGSGCGVLLEVLPALFLLENVYHLTAFPFLFTVPWYGYCLPVYANFGMSWYFCISSIGT